MKRRLMIVFCTGRLTVRPVARMLTLQLERSGHFERYALSLVFAIDPEFSRCPLEQFVLSRDIAVRYKSVQYLGPSDCERFARAARRAGVRRRDTDILFGRRGYSSQKNMAIVHSVQHGAEYLLFLDDDEYFVAPFREKSGLAWYEQDVVGVQLSTLRSVDVGSGLKTGYFSPIPSGLSRHVSEDTLRRLGEVLGVGNEVVTGSTFCGGADSLVAYGEDSTVRERSCRRNVLSGGNLCISIEASRAGLLPPFLNPPGARGEDAILSTQLSRAKVRQAPVYTFHDPFQQHLGITRGVYPSRLRPASVSRRSVERLGAACLGWVRYAPLWLRLTETSTWRDRVQQMRDELVTLGPHLSRALNYPGFAQLADNLAHYSMRAGKDLDELMWAREAWPRVMTGV